MPGQSINRVLSFGNPLQQTLTIKNVQLTPPLLIGEFSPTITAGAVGLVRLELAEARPAGAYQGLLRINFTDERVEPIEIDITGHFVPPIELQPYPAFFAVTDLGENAMKTLEIINHQETPLNIKRVEHQSERFELQLEEIKAGRHYRLSMTLKGDEPADKLRESIRLVTDDPDGKALLIPAYTQVHDRVYVFPETVDMGRLPLTSVSAGQATRLSQALMVYGKGRSDFELSAYTDLEYIRIDKERGATGDRFQLTLSLIPEKLRPGVIDGTIVLTTNDPLLPELSVPVTGSIFVAKE